MTNLESMGRRIRKELVKLISMVTIIVMGFMMMVMLLCFVMFYFISILIWG